MGEPDLRVKHLKAKGVLRHATVKQYRRAAADELAALTCVVLGG
jgi:hypothetical protein